MGERRLFTNGLLVAAVIMLLDQISKWWIVEQVMNPPRVIPVTSFFNLVMGWNKGVSFGMFASDSPLNRWVLPIIALAVVAALTVWMWRNTDRLITTAIALVIGGAIGNVIDRIRFGAVADFLDFFIGSYHWPAFNVADIAITCGAGLLIFDSLFRNQESPKREG
jgi:signal peptidase II